jgi:hypothetical protein
VAISDIGPYSHEQLVKNTLAYTGGKFNIKHKFVQNLDVRLRILNFLYYLRSLAGSSKVTYSCTVSNELFIKFIYKDEWLIKCFLQRWLINMFLDIFSGLVTMAILKTS